MLKMKRNIKDTMLMMQCWCNAKGNSEWNAKHNAKRDAIALLLSKAIKANLGQTTEKRGNGGDGRAKILPFTGS